MRSVFVAEMELGLLFEHGTCDRKEAVSDAAEHLSRPVSASAKRSVFGLADSIVLRGGTGPMMYCVLETLVSGAAGQRRSDHRVTGTTPHRQRRAW